MMKLIAYLKQIQRKELLRFLAGGGSVVIIDFTFYRLLIYFGATISISKAISFFIGAIVGFIINKFWTFERPKLSAWEIIRYIILYIVSGTANNLVNSLVLFIFQYFTVFAFLCASGISTIMNFLGMKYFVFKAFRKLPNGEIV